MPLLVGRGFAPQGLTDDARIIDIFVNAKSNGIEWTQLAKKSGVTKNIRNS
ncbi:MAG: hypothetical protein ACPGO7_00825 [Alphaproteobacteria bacterium]